MWITNLASGTPNIRPIMLKVLFPHRDLENEEVKDQNAIITPAGSDFPCVGNRLIKFMTAVERATKHFSTELLYTLVNEDGAYSVIRDKTLLFVLMFLTMVISLVLHLLLAIWLQLKCLSSLLASETRRASWSSVG